MAIQVSYLEAKAYPEWVKVKAESVSSFKGGFTYPGTVKPEIVKSSGQLPPTPGPPANDPWAELSQIYFEVMVGANTLGRWNKIEGLGVRIEVGEHRTGDGDNYRWYEPTYTTYTPLKLSRATSVAATAEMVAWLTHTQFGWKRGLTAQITARPLWKNATPLWTITLQDVMPVAWTGPQFSSEGKVAMETLELVHSGFIDPHPGQSGPPPLPTGTPPPAAPKALTPLAPPPERSIAGLLEAAGAKK